MTRLLGDNVKNIFITGGSGFIGSHICDILVDQGYNVTIFDNFSNGKREFTSHHLGKHNFRLIEGDCLDLKMLITAMCEHDLVWHMAANTDLIGSHEQPDRDLRDCVIATFNTLEAMRANGIKDILFASSGAVYGKLCLEKEVEEGDGPFMPMSAYAAGKISSEAFICAYSHMFNINAWIFRFGNVIGTRVTHGIIFDFISKLKKNPNELMILGDGNQEKNYFLTEDCIDGMAWAYRNVKLDNMNNFEIFNLGTSSVSNVVDIAKIIIEAMNLQSKTIIKIQGNQYAWLGDQPRVHLNVNKIKSMGWSCLRSSDEAVQIAVRRVLGEHE